MSKHHEHAKRNIVYVCVYMMYIILIVKFNSIDLIQNKAIKHVQKCNVMINKL